MLGLLRILAVFLLYFPLTTMSFKVYDAYFYSEEILPKDDILNSDVSKCLRLEYAVDVSKKDFITAANKVLNRQFSPERLKAVENELNTLHDGYTDVKKGDSYSLCYHDADETTTLSLNGNDIVSISSADFAEIYFSIWLGSSDPLDKKLRKNLLAAAIDS